MTEVKFQNATIDVEELVYQVRCTIPECKLAVIKMFLIDRLSEYYHDLYRPEEDRGTLLMIKDEYLTVLRGIVTMKSGDYKYNFAYNFSEIDFWHVLLTICSKISDEESMPIFDAYKKQLTLEA